jgi:L-lactate dehydrogenase
VRIAEMILGDERAVIPIGSYQKQFGVTLSLPSIVGRNGVEAVLSPELREGLQNSANTLRDALSGVLKS